MKQLTKEQHEAICEPIENQTKTESSLYDIYIENGTACEEALKRIKIKWKKPKA